jgi:hypothetical protein
LIHLCRNTHDSLPALFDKTLDYLATELSRRIDDFYTSENLANLLMRLLSPKNGMSFTTFKRSIRIGTPGAVQWVIRNPAA